MPTPATTAAGLGALVARLEPAVGCKVDLVDLTAAELPFVGPLLRERIVVVDREPGARHAWEADTTSRWLEFEPSYRASPTPYCTPSMTVPTQCVVYSNGSPS